MQKKQPHFVSASCRAQHPGIQEASKHMQKKQPHFVSDSCRAQHPGNKKPANHAGKNPILLALVVVLNILENKQPANHAEKTAPFC